MNVKELREKLTDLPDEMEVIGECSTGQENVLDVEVCNWEHDGMYYSDQEKEEYPLPNAEQTETPLLKITIRY